MPPSRDVSPTDTATLSHSPHTPLQRFALKATVIYFAMLFVDMILDGSNGTRRPLDAIQRAVVSAVVNVAGGPPAGARTDWISHSAISTLVLIASTIGAACLVALLWTMLDRTRREYPRLELWLRTVLRYYAAVIVLIYGGVKVINSQFPPVQLDQMLEPFGMMNPMALLWNYMGYSDAYSSFAGFGEVLGALLLFNRRTVTLGAGILLAVMSNVALLNFAYGVPVKGLSTNLVIIALVLLAPDVQRLIDVFVLNRATSPMVPAPPLGGRRLARVRRVLKPAIVLLALVAPMVFSSRMRPRLHKRSPLYGIYDVRTQVRNGDTLDPLLTSVTRWRRVVFGAPERSGIQFMNDSMLRLVAEVDTTRQQLTLKDPRGARNAGSLVYREGEPGVLQLNGRFDGDSLSLELVRQDLEHRYPLSRGFRWFGS